MKTRSPLRILSLATALASALTAQVVPTHAIGRLEAVHLVEHLDGRFVANAVDVRFSDGRAVFVLDGLVDGEHAQAVVDAAVARVLSLDVGGDARYRFDGQRAVAHRGAAVDAPENTLAGFRRAAALGADAVEIDIRPSKDGVLVCMHDATLARTTDGAGQVDERTAADLTALDAGRWFDPSFSGERVPTLRQALELVARTGCAPDLDFKAGDPRRLVALVREFELEDRATLWTEEWNLGRAVVALEPKIRWRPTWRPDRMSLLEWQQQTGASIVTLDWRFVTEARVREIHLRGLLAFVSVIGDGDTSLARRLAIEAGADFVQSGDVGALVAVLRQHGLKAGAFGERQDRVPLLDAPSLAGIPRRRLGAGTPLEQGPSAENSGLVASRQHPGTLWMLNDSGDEPRVYAAHRDGSVVGAPAPGAAIVPPGPGVVIGGAINVDWEDIAIDASNHLIVADLGNNANTRRDLCLYYLQEPYPTSQRTTWLKRVWFRYPRQEAIPAPRDDMDYDAEGIFALGDRVFVWSKNRSDRESDLYVLDDPTEGQVHDLRFVGAFRFDGSVTGADASADGAMVAVLTYAGVWVFDRFPAADRVLDGRVRVLPVQGAQLEGVAFVDRDTLILSDELRGTLHEVSLDGFHTLQLAGDR